MVGLCILIGLNLFPTSSHWSFAVKNETGWWHLVGTLRHHTRKTTQNTASQPTIAPHPINAGDFPLKIVALYWQELEWSVNQTHMANTGARRAALPRSQPTWQKISSWTTSELEMVHEPNPHGQHRRGRQQISPTQGRGQHRHGQCYFDAEILTHLTRKCYHRLHRNLQCSVNQTHMAITGSSLPEFE